MNGTIIAVGVACFVAGFLLCLLINGWLSWRSRRDQPIQPKEYRSNK